MSIIIQPVTGLPVQVQAGSVDLTSGWNTLIGAPGVSTVLHAIGWIGVAIIVILILGWLFRKMRGGGGGVMRGFPWMGVVVGGVMVAPTILIPILLTVLGVIISLGGDFIAWAAGTF